LNTAHAAPAAGILLADKPSGITSHDVVARARHALGTRKVGHAGTLDPFATGLLILLVGRATRLQRFFMALAKTYEVTARLGASSSTGDTEGEITETGRMPPEPIALPLGRTRQRPPAHSAVKIGGERAYLKARRGEIVETPEREVEVYGWEVLWRDGDRIGLRISCSAGTYIRSLISDLGDAYCEALRRTAIGPFTTDAAWPTQGPVELIDVLTACRRFVPSIPLGDSDAQAIRRGPIATNTTHPLVLVTDISGSTIGLAVRRESGTGVTLRPMLTA
jgi:tRNA pseudouridine55 synthase